MRADPFEILGGNRMKGIQKNLSKFLISTLILLLCAGLFLPHAGFAVEETTQQAEEVKIDGKDENKNFPAEQNTAVDSLKMEDQTDKNEEQSNTEAGEKNIESNIQKQVEKEDESIRETRTMSMLAPRVVRRAPMARGGAEPAHKKKIEPVSGQEDLFRITLDVKGGVESITTKPKLDIVFIVDSSGSMTNELVPKNNYDATNTRMNELKKAVTKEGGLSASILENPNVDAQIAAVKFSGKKDRTTEYNYLPYDDASVIQTWTSSKAQIDSSINELKAQGQTNYEAGFEKVRSQLVSGMRPDATKVLIFLTDGNVNLSYNDSGYSIVPGHEWDNLYADSDSETYEYVVNRAKAELSRLLVEGGFSAYYQIAFSNDINASSNQALNALKNQATAQYVTNKTYQANDSEELSNAFKDIQQNITNYEATNIKITDELSEYVDFKSTDARNFKVVRVLNGVETEIGAPSVTVTVDSATKKVTAKFRDDYAIEQGALYKFSFLVKPSQRSYDEGASSGYISQSGFPSNKNATLTYKYSGSPETVKYYENPTFKFIQLDIPVKKIWQNVSLEDAPSSVTVNLYQDGSASVYKSITLLKGDSFEGKFENVAKGHTYTIDEVVPSGYHKYKVENKGTVAKPSFEIINRKLPSLTLTKEVSGEFANMTKQFSVNLTIKKKDGTALIGTYPYTYDGTTGNVNFDSNGMARVTLIHGKPLKISNLPVDATYTVSEDASSAKGYEVTYENRTGTLDSDKSAKVKNVSAPVPPTGVDLSTGNKWFIFTIFLFGIVLFIRIDMVRSRQNRRNI